MCGTKPSDKLTVLEIRNSFEVKLGKAEEKQSMRMSEDDSVIVGGSEAVKQL